MGTTLEAKIAIVTGANSGMGLETTIALVNKNVKVIMLCRSQSRGEIALEKVKEVTGKDSMELMVCDLSSLKSIDEFSSTFYNKFDHLDLLINNAGVVTLKRQETADGFEMMLGVNHLGHFHLTYALLDALKAAPSARVVIVSSGAHKWGKMDFSDPYFTKGFNVAKGYGRSKLANVLFMKGLHEKVSHTNITVNALHPGAVATNIGVDRNTGFGGKLVKLLVPFFKTAEQGAETAVYLATSEDVEGISGQYFIDKKQVPLSQRAKDPQLIEHFWRWSIEQTKV